MQSLSSWSLRSKTLWAPSRNLSKDLQQQIPDIFWDFINKEDEIMFIMELTEGANYLEVKSLHELGCAYIAEKMK